MINGTTTIKADDTSSAMEKVVTQQWKGICQFSKRNDKRVVYRANISLVGVLSIPYF